MCKKDTDIVCLYLDIGHLGRCSVGNECQIWQVFLKPNPTARTTLVC